MDDPEIDAHTRALLRDIAATLEALDKRIEQIPDAGWAALPEPVSNALQDIHMAKGHLARFR